MSELVYTPVHEIPNHVAELRASFHSQKTLPIQFRLNQLRNLYYALFDNMDAICDSLQKDFNRAPSETRNLEFTGILAEILHTMRNLESWLKHKPLEKTPFAMSTANCYTEKIPLGVICVISPFNYPLVLSCSPVLGAIASGNCVVLKPSELVPHFATLLSSILTDALDPSIFRVINGSINETTALLEQKFDKIIYTGNSTVGKIVASKAAETLTPVLLELGGKSPAIITNSNSLSQLTTIARRVCWAKFANAGQTCIAVDYVLCDESISKEFAAIVKKIVEDEFFPFLNDPDSKPETDPNFTHIIHDRSFERLSKIINTSHGVLVTGGTIDKQTRYIEPTVFSSVEWEDSTMTDELFGPILPIVTYKDLSDALDSIVKYHDTPLACYLFTTDHKEEKLVMDTVRSGFFTINDCLIQGAVYTAPFGGVGQSGMGSYHSTYSIAAFTHERFVMKQPMWNDFILKMRYYPSTMKNDLLLWKSFLGDDKVWFERDGDVNVHGPNFVWSVFVGFGGMVSLFWYLLF